MSVYLKQFSTHSEYEAYIASEGKVLPNVSICTTEGDVHYNPWVETRVVAKFNVTSTSSPTPIGYNEYTIGFSEIEIDGVVQQSVVSAYTFDTIGEHTVKYTLKNQTSIGGWAFGYCSGLTSIDIPNSVTSIGNMVFEKCRSLTSCTIGSGVTTIGIRVFYNCSSLTSCTIGSGVTSIGGGAFSGCTSLTSIDIPSGVTRIGDYAFNGCSSLTSIDIPSGVTSIDQKAFERCSSLISVTVNATTPPTLGGDAFSDNAAGRKIYAPSGSVEAYKAATNWSTYASDIEPIS